MLEVTFYRDGRERLTGLSARGHAGFARHGKDIVCAAVSAILQAAHLGLSEHARVRVEARRAPGDFHLRWSAREGARESVAAIVATAELAISQIARRHPEHVRLRHARMPQSLGGLAQERVTPLADRRRVCDV